MTGVAERRVMDLGHTNIRCISARCVRGRRVRAGVAVMTGGTVGVLQDKGRMIYAVVTPAVVDSYMTAVTVLVRSACTLTRINDILRSYGRSTRIHISCILMTGQTVART
jgi:hypothetical protein